MGIIKTLANKVYTTLRASSGQTMPATAYAFRMTSTRVFAFQTTSIKAYFFQTTSVRAYFF